MKTPAQTVIEKFGGHARISEILGVDVSRVHRWTYPKDRGGTDGLIPQKHQGKLLIAAQASGIDLEPADFFPPISADRTETVRQGIG